MKKHIRIIFSLIVTLSLMMSIFVLNVSAASVTISGGNYEVGQKVSVPIKFEGDNALVSVFVDANYNASVLRLDSVSGVDAKDVNKGNGNVKFIDENFSNGSKKGSYTLNFTAIAAGSSDVQVSASGSDGTNEFGDTKTAKITVTTPKPSSNADLSSIKLSAGSLSPAFNPATLFYDVTVRYDVEEITITGTKADGKSTYIGGGTFALDVTEDKNGDGQYTADELNERVLTVTAEDGSKKSYIIYIRRLTEEETLAAEDEERNSNPTLVIINGVDYTIDNELNGVEIPAGFTKATATRKESEITVLKDDAGKYQLCWLIDNNGQGAFYIRDEADNFTKLVYISSGGKMYIVEPLDIDDILPSDYKYSKCIIDGVEVKCITYVDSKLNEFNIFSCYINGKTAYYRLDSVEGTMQRAVDLDIAFETKEVVVQPEAQSSTPVSDNNGPLKNVNKTGKIVLALVVAVAAILIAIAIILIVKIASSKDDYDYGDEETNAKDFVFGDDYVAEPVVEAQPPAEEEAIPEETELPDADSNNTEQSEETTE